MGEILGHIMKHGGLGILDSSKSARQGCGTSVASCKELLVSLLDVMEINYVGHRACMRKSIAVSQKEWTRDETTALAHRKDKTGNRERSRLGRVTQTGEWLTAVAHCLNGTDFSHKEFQ